MSKTLQVRLNSKLYQKVQTLTDEKGLSMSEWLRALIVEALETANVKNTPTRGT